MADITIASGHVTKLAHKLGPTATAKLFGLSQATEDAHAVLQAISKQFNEARGEWERARYAHDTLVADRNVPDKKRITASSAELAQLRTEYDRHSARQAKISGEWNDLASTLSRVNAYLSALPAEAKLNDAAPSKPLKKVAGADVERIREVIEKLKGDRASVIAAPIPSSEAKVMARAFVEEIANRAAPHLFGLDASAFRIEFPTIRAKVDAHSVTGGGSASVSGAAYHVDPVGLAAWLDPEKMIAALGRDIDEVAQDEIALDGATRGYREDELDRLILEAERTEEGLIEQALAAGMKVVRREDADVRAILGVDGPAPKDEV
ncbi:MAG: hypothetical protein E5W19_28080 [Mesorhizobium sp.]|nr:MAG: hypothetical protein E5W19_28080 [Mesorhizobium sp.]